MKSNLFRLLFTLLIGFTILIYSCSSSKQAFVPCTNMSCSYCHGTGKIGVCSTCEGKGTISCVSCNPDQQVCDKCNGLGEKLCGEYVTSK